MTFVYSSKILNLLHDARKVSATHKKILPQPDFLS